MLQKQLEAEKKKKSIDKPKKSIDKPKKSIDKPKKSIDKSKKSIDKKTFFFLEVKNEFFQWVMTLPKQKYFSQWSAIRRIKEHKRYSITEDSIELFLLFLKEKGWRING